MTVEFCITNFYKHGNITTIKLNHLSIRTWRMVKHFYFV